MANTTPDGIYYPDSNTLMNFDSILASMASSIQNGIGKRLALQEIAIGLKAGLTTSISLDPVFKKMNLSITSNYGSFNQGFTFANGTATVVTPGMYMISGGLGVMNTANGSAKMALLKNNITVCADEQPSLATNYVVGKATSVISCVAGDTISLWGASAPGTLTTSPNLELTHLSIAMVQAIPQA